jgi:transposase
VSLTGARRCVTYVPGYLTVRFEGGGNGVRSLSIWRKVIKNDRTVVESVDFDELTDAVVVSARPYAAEQRRCGKCGQRCAFYDQRGVRRRWRMPDVGVVRAYLEAELRRVSCPEHGVVKAAVPWARHDVGHTHDFDSEVAWLVCRMSKTAVCKKLRIAWRTVGQIIDRVVADEDAISGDRLAGIRKIGIDEISYRRGHKYLTVVVDHDTGRLLWAAPGRDKATLVEFFELLGPERCAQISLVSADAAEWIYVAVADKCRNAKQCLDPFHVVAWATKALDKVRGRIWAQARRDGQKALAGDIKGARYALWKNPEDLTSRQQAKLAEIGKTNLPLYRAYLLKEQFRQIFATGGEERTELLDEWLKWAARSRIPEFVDLARRIRIHFRADIINTLIYRLSNGRIESVNTKIRLLTRVAFGFKSPEALIALVKLHLGGYNLPLPGRS